MWWRNTHLIRNIFPNYWCGMHLTCKKQSSKTDRHVWKIWGDKPQWRKLSMSLFKAAKGSEVLWVLTQLKFQETKVFPDCDNSAVLKWKNDLPVLGLAGCHSEKRKLMQVRRADQALYHHELTVSSLGSVCQSCTAPLLLKWNDLIWNLCKQK